MTEGYTDSFYVAQRGGSSESADLVVPRVLSLVAAKSVIDVGCGVGAWAAKFLQSGVPDVLGIDGDYVNRQLLLVPPACFEAHDLSRPIQLNRRFDLAICMEVAEHLPHGRATGLVDDLTRLAPVVLFSAAIPGQGGTNHINEQYLSYWVELFSARNYLFLDIIRPAIWHNQNVGWCYRQNAVIFAHKDEPVAAAGVASGIDYVHPELYELYRERVERPTLGYLVRSFPGSLRRSLAVRLKRGQR